jgi:DNA topoisomerase-3
MTTVVLCEKPDQARVHANLFGIDESSKGYYKAKNGWIFTYSIGHMVEQLEPGKLNPQWDKWTLDALPIIPEVWKVAACEGKGEQLRTVIGLLKKADEIIIATDCGREGELIGRELIELSGNRKHKLMRFWSSALDEKSLRAAWNALRPGEEFDTLHQAALIRSRFDYMWGMTNSRGATLSLAPPKVVYPVGRVQTPVLNLVVQRHLAIENFTPKVFFTLSAQVDTPAGSLEMVYEPKAEENRIWEKAAADKLAAAVAGAKGPLGVETNDRKESPPKFPSLTDLQKRASRKWQWPLDKTLQVCQSLYEDKYISYPRSECNLMPEEQMGDVPEIVAGITAAGWVKALAVTGSAEPLYRKDRFKPESEIQKDFDHHAVLPTKNTPKNLSGDERQMYELIALWFVRALAPDYEYNQVDARLSAGGIFLTAKGITPIRIGFKALEGKPEGDEADDKKDDSRALPAVTDGMAAAVQSVDVKQGKTTAPPFYTEGTLLEDMISVHKFVKNPEHRARLKETSGLGTVATRANIIKELRGRKLIVAGAKKGTIDCSPSAIALIQALPEILRDPGQTAVWEDCMDNVRKGTVSFQDAMRAAEGAVRRCAQLFQEKGVSDARGAFNESHAAAMTPVLEFNGFGASCPVCESSMAYVANGKFGPFWGCTVRECKGILKAGADGKPIPKAEAAVGETCPKCKKKHLVLRQGSRGPFWACSGYPKCKHTQPVDGEK